MENQSDTPSVSGDFREDDHQAWLPASSWLWRGYKAAFVQICLGRVLEHFLHGQAGANIIEHNMHGVDSACVDVEQTCCERLLLKVYLFFMLGTLAKRQAMVEGTRVECILGATRIRDFSTATEAICSRYSDSLNFPTPQNASLAMSSGTSGQGDDVRQPNSGGMLGLFANADASLRYVNISLDRPWRRGRVPRCCQQKQW